MGIWIQMREPIPDDKQLPTQDGLPLDGYRVRSFKYPWVTPMARLSLNFAAQPIPQWLPSELSWWSSKAQRPLTQLEIDALVYLEVKSLNPQYLLLALGCCASIYHTVRRAAYYRLAFRTDVVLRKVGFPWPTAERGVVKGSNDIRHIRLGIHNAELSRVITCGVSARIIFLCCWLER